LHGDLRTRFLEREIRRGAHAGDPERIRFTPAILPPYALRSKSLEMLIPILYLKGVSTGNFEEALAALLGKDAPGLSASTIAPLKEVWIDEHKRWNERDLSTKRYIYVWADGIHLQARLEDNAQCILVIIGATPEGRKELVGFTDGTRESAHDWRTLLLDLKRRGLSVAPELAAADGALGFWKVLGEVWPKTREQRCWVHKTANVLKEGSRSAARLLRFSRQALEALENDKPHGKHLRDRAAQDHPIEGVPLEQDHARHGIQAGRGRTEELAPSRRPQPVAKNHPGCEVHRRARGRRQAGRPSGPNRRRLILPAVTKNRR
jgi:hypothetical protein